MAPVTLITGGGTGIGAAAARLLLARGHRVAVTGRRAGPLAELAAEGALPLTGDTADAADVEAAVAATVAEYGRLDHVVANAGISTHDTLADGDPERWKAMLLTNVLGPALLIRAALPALKESGGRVVLVGSTAGVRNTPGNMYSVTKFAVTALAENARVLVTGDGVGVTLVAPGRVETPFWDSRDGGAPDGPMLTAEQIAEAIAWAVGQPAGVDVNSIVVRPVGQVP
ncbi:SDR family oxidoreductase [Actinomadura macrotermitis]|uniref:Putative oxidoreductase n=1 Tax=Actinomadura macrotermitis TaxID=2585200 RepID=A0A7K0C8F3_9ACTN|nr:SDR family NAD(P)-dependent oxidoreductase [Actinomadura macrotermitis]MQY09382.1 putative oxidoreductase [Actinomadura macrotermitis]